MGRKKRKKKKTSDTTDFRRAILITLMLLLIMTLVEVLKNQLDKPHELYALGVFPREWKGLAGIFAMPIIHGSYSHLWSNIVPFAVLGLVLFSVYPRTSLIAFPFMWVFTGLMVWLIARGERVHIGASGLVYAMGAFLASNGFFRKGQAHLALSMAILVVNEGYFMSLKDRPEGVSWEAHLIGFFTGVFAAFIFRNIMEQRDLERLLLEKEIIGSPEEEKTLFFAPDTFVYTKAERYQMELERIERERMEQLMRDQGYDGFGVS